MDGHQYTARFEAVGGNPVLKAYPDPLTGREPWTIGIGHTGPDVHEHTVWTEDQCWHAFYNDYGIAEAAASHVAGVACWSHLNEPRRCVLTDMAFNIGQVRLAGFHKMISAIQNGQWKMAEDELLSSVYASQVKSRARINANVLLTGLWPGEMAVS
jgi:GH24 family phage-related lysozyme (muramidase)